jgi:chromosome segregation ATPase
MARGMLSNDFFTAQMDKGEKGCLRDPEEGPQGHTQERRRMMRLLGTFLIGMGILALTGCNGTNKSVTAQAKKKAKQFQEEMQTKLDKLDEQIAKYKEKAENASGDAKQAMEDKLEELNRKRKELGDQLEQLTDKGEDAWEEAKDKVEEAYNDFAQAVKDAAEEFK